MQRSESDYAGQVTERLRRALNPEAASGKLDLNFHGHSLLASLLQETDPNAKGTNDQAKAYYANLAQQIINKRSELGLFKSFDQVTSVPGVTTSVVNVLRQRTFIGEFNVLNQETVGPQVGRELQQKAVWAIVLSTLAMGVYLWIRFNVMFGASAIVCIIHDVCISVAFLGMIH